MARISPERDPTGKRTHAAGHRYLPHMTATDATAWLPATLRGDPLLDAALTAADAARAVILEGAAARSSLVWESKSALDYVSDVDRGAEHAIRAVLAARYPDAHIIGEEFSPDALVGDALTFVVDPLDGTTNFLHGFPWYAVSIGVLSGGTLLAGVVHNAATDERFVARHDQGAWRRTTEHDAERLAVSTIATPSHALIGTGFPFKHRDLIEPYLAQFARIAESTAGMRRPGAAALDLCDVACGRFEAFWELRLAAWDVAAGICILREAGGRATDLSGADARITTGPVVASNGLLHDWLLDTLHGRPT
jgi:myo-inositol-1(or 4)-monophosphatase